MSLSYPSLDVLYPSSAIAFGLLQALGAVGHHDLDAFTGIDTRSKYAMKTLGSMRSYIFQFWVLFEFNSNLALSVPLDGHTAVKYFSGHRSSESAHTSDYSHVYISTHICFYDACIYINIIHIYIYIYIYILISVCVCVWHGQNYLFGVWWLPVTRCPPLLGTVS